MIAELQDTFITPSPSVLLGEKIRQARKSKGWTISKLAEKIGRQREWLNRVELGYSKFGEYRPASRADVLTIIDLLGDNIEDSSEELLTLVDASEREYLKFKPKTQGTRRNTLGKLTQTEVIIGESQIIQAITELIDEQHADAVIRNTGIKSPGNYLGVTEEWKKYRLALGNFLAKNPNSLFKRVEYVATGKHLQRAKDADEKLGGNRSLKNVHNAKLKFYQHNPLQMHILIGQREAILALPQTSGQAGSNIAILVRDKIFVEALRVWYDEVLWDAPGASKMVDFSDFKESFEQIKQMYKFESHNN